MRRRFSGLHDTDMQRPFDFAPSASYRPLQEVRRDGSPSKTMTPARKDGQP
ncbi:hypothetical protein SAMN05518845_110268 [Variovorax sp. YR750]|nr:hypothetical protein [Variovorax paradoxus]SEF28291.1 hypothetical protein SAMN03159371_03579 [Variovorax sp. NFACC28]SEG77126.1 hypothetical protein SAMN03159365_03658 [Variovorax sp. NFACC29]SEL74239.1 hypothetical protein SAMN05518845_110268 [Variovorax sp. YR750]SFC98703.1 hypothetical protein SAMN03159379_03764 [Variovorax sp. NFACC26]SFG11115.1 hypothetical protein SAMN03159447_01873 [Variovorax sp. NFACC27]